MDSGTGTTRSVVCERQIIADKLGIQYADNLMRGARLFMRHAERLNGPEATLCFLLQTRI